MSLARLLQTHHCTPSCTSNPPEGQLCSQYFPLPPSRFNIIAVRPKLITEDDEEALKRLEAVVQNVQHLIREGGQDFQQEVDEEEEIARLVRLLRQLGEAPQQLPSGGFQWAGAAFSPCHDLDSLLVDCSSLVPEHADALLLALWHSCLLHRRHARFIPKRNLNETSIANFNPWVTLATLANMDLEVVLATPEKVEAYCCKGTRQLSLHRAIQELKARGGPKDKAAARRLEWEVAAGRREVSLTEAFFLSSLDSGLYMTAKSPAGVVFVSAAISEDGQVSISLAKQRYSWRPVGLEAQTLAHFLMWYRVSNPGKEELTAWAEDGATCVVTCADLAPDHPILLPQRILLQDENQTRMVKRRKPSPVYCSPHSVYSDIVMLKVSSSLYICPH